MKILRLIGKKVHGYIDYDIKFFRDITFLTGINGSGKTTAINAIAALITPDIRILSELEYREIYVHVEHNSKESIIYSLSDEDKIIISVRGIEEIFSYEKYVYDPEVTQVMYSEAQSNYYREIVSLNSSHPVMKFISSLPAPMFLGLDRRARFHDDITRAKRHFSQRSPRFNRNVFSPSLTTSLADAARLAQENYRDALIHSSNIVERLQREMILNLITVEPGAEHHFATISLPDQKTRRELKYMQNNLPAIAELLKLDHEDVKKRIIPLIDLLKKSARDIPETATVDSIFSQASTNQKVLSAAFSWSSNQDHLKRIRDMLSVVDKYNQLRDRSFEKINLYANLINGFLKDSGKKIHFSPRGSIYISVEGAVGEKDISSLSSGEAQIFVILTHLSFNELAQMDNVFIIDEPELSLHVQWQELFADSVVRSNPNVQYIMATHSPSIILDKVGNCVNVSISN